VINDANWWVAYSDQFSESLLTYVSTEDGAIRIKQFQSKVIPTLLQTPAYARAVMLAFGDEFGLVDRALQMRMRRQATHFSGGRATRMSFVLDESVLVRRVGNDETMAGQRTYLEELDGQPNVTIRIVPMGHGPYPEMDKQFAVHILSEAPRDRVAYTEDDGMQVAVDGYAKVNDCSADFDRLSRELAVDLSSPMLIRQPYRS
jgi:hypothetical protein